MIKTIMNISSNDLKERGGYQAAAAVAMTTKAML